MVYLGRDRRQPTVLAQPYRIRRTRRSLLPPAGWPASRLTCMSWATLSGARDLAEQAMAMRQRLVER